MQSIITRYIGPGNVRGSRVKATHSGGAVSVTLGWDSALDSTENHMRAARALCERLHWHGTLTGGEGKHGWTWVFVDPASPTFTVDRTPGL